MTLGCRDLTIEVRAATLLRGVSCDLRPGRVTVVLGPNGAGKSTLLKALAGLIAPSGGEVSLDGSALGAVPAIERARRIGYLPQSAELAWNLRVRDLVALGRLPHRDAAPYAHEQAIDQALDAVDAFHLSDRAVLTLSGGERARVLMARVLAGKPDWILADEPLASLDPAHQLAMLHLFRATADRGAGVVVVLHDLTLAAKIADDAVLLSGGRVLATGVTDDVMTADQLKSAFGVDVERVRLSNGGHALVPIAVPESR